LGAIGAGLPFLLRYFGEYKGDTLGFIVGGVAVCFAVNIIADRIAMWVTDEEISAVAVTVRQMRLSLAERVTAAKEMALSLTYLGKLRERHSNIKLALLVFASALLVLSFSFPELNLFEFSTVPIAALGLLVLKEAVVQYRIHRGLFGTIRSEARELIDFLVNNSNDIDFTDSNGNLRKALLPEVSERGEKKPDFTSGGVTI
jgi:hypothetical protein